MTNPIEDPLQQHQDNVQEIGDKVGELVKNAKTKARFTGQIDRLCNMVEKYGQALQVYRQIQPELSPEREKILTSIKSGGRLLNVEEEINLVELTRLLPSPPSGFVKMCYADYAFIADSLHFAYRLAKLVNPLLWFDIFGNADIQQKPKPEDELMCDYVKLAVIHGCTLRGPAKGDTIVLNGERYFFADPDNPKLPYPNLPERLFSYEYTGRWFKREEFRKQVWQYYSHTQIPRDLQKELRKKLSELKDALERIQSDPGSKQVPWNENDPQFMFASEAIVTFTNSKLPVPTLSNMLKPDGPIRYMRKGHRCKVHICDFRQWAEQHYPSDKTRGEIADDYIADVEARKTEIRKGR
jgi:predicted DNA-binding protein YlxM (UPF0122 family)